MSSETPDQYRPNTNCIICLQLADEALVTSCCVDIICTSCMEKLPTKRCPKCRFQNFQAKPELFIRKFIQEISPQIQLFINPITGTVTFTMKLRQLDTLDMLFQRVNQRTGVPIDQMRLVFGSKNLTPIKKSLKSIKIQNNSTIHQLGRLRGGK